MTIKISISVTDKETIDSLDNDTTQVTRREQSIKKNKRNKNRKEVDERARKEKKRKRPRET